MLLRPLCNELQEKSMKELNEVPSRVKQDIEDIKQWLSKQPHMQCIKDDPWILCYLRACKFSLHITKQKLYHYCMLRVSVPKPFSNRDPFLPELQEFLSSGVVTILPETEVLAPRRILVQAKLHDPDPDIQSVTFKVIAMLVEMLIFTDDESTINGQEIIFDLDKVKYKSVTQFTPYVIKMLSVALQQAYPARLKGFHIINFSPLVATMVTLFKSLLSKKLSSRVFIYEKKCISELYKVIPLSALPNEYGGNAGTTEELAGELKSRIEALSDWFIEDGKRVVSEKELEIWKSLNVYDIEGSFRKLDID